MTTNPNSKTLPLSEPPSSAEPAKGTTPTFVRRFRFEPVLILVTLAAAAWWLLTPPMTYPWAQNWDETFYMAQASSFAFDLDYDIGNDLFYTNLPAWSQNPDDYLSIAYQLKAPPDARPRSTFSVGSSLVWAPVLWAGRLANAADRSSDFVYEERFTPELKAQMALWSALLGGIAVYVAYVLARLHGIGSRSAAASACIVFMLTPAAFWTFRSPGYAHLASMFAATLFFFACWHYRRRRSALAALTVGMLGGLVYIIRWADIVYLIVGLFVWTSLAVAEIRERPGFPRRAALHALAGGFGFVLLALFQWISWKHNFGEWITTPQGAGFLTWSDPRFANLLWRSYNAFLPWAPITLLAIPGLFLWIKRKPFWGAAYAFALLLAIYMAAIPADVEGGWSFGSRRLTSLYPILVIGLAHAFDLSRIGRSRIACAACCVLAFALGLFLIRLREAGVRDLLLAFREHGPMLGEPAKQALKLMTRFDFPMQFQQQLSIAAPVTAAAFVLLLIAGCVFVRVTPKLFGSRARRFVLLAIVAALAIFHPIALTKFNRDRQARRTLASIAEASTEGHIKRALELAQSLDGKPRFELQARLLAADVCARKGRRDLAFQALAPVLTRSSPDALPAIRSTLTRWRRGY